jgi:hypothetical protein
MKDVITSILTDTSVRSDSAVEQNLIHQAELATPWSSVEVS